MRKRGREFMNENRRIGSRLKQQRQRIGLSEGSAAYLLGIVRSQLQKIEGGEGTLVAGRVKRFCEVLDMTPNELFGIRTK